MENIVPHLDQMESAGIPKLEAVKAVGKRITDNEAEIQRRLTVVARMENFAGSDKNLADTMNREALRDEHQLFTMDHAVHHWQRDRFDALVTKFEHSASNYTKQRVKFT
jgi:hypothetical protein